MSELKNVAEDVKSGALPVSEIPRFLWYLFRGIFWAAFALIVIFALCVLLFASG